MSQTPLYSRLKTLSDEWREYLAIFPDDVPDHGSSPIPKEEFLSWLERGSLSLKHAEMGTSDPAMKLVTQPGIIAQIDAIQTALTQSRQSGPTWFAQARVAFNVMNNVWEIRKLVAWLQPEDLSAVLATAWPAAAEAPANVRFLADAAREASLLEERAQASRKQLDATEAQIEEALARLEGHERVAATAQTNASAAATNAAASKIDVDTLLEDLRLGVQTKDDLITVFQAKKMLVEETLQGASKVGLAKSFMERRVALTKSQTTWALVFASGLCAIGLLAFASLVIYPVEIGHSPAISFAANAVSGAGAIAPTGGVAERPDTLEVVLAYLTHLVVISPMVWLTWFAARKYGQLSRLVEDYAFKEASAMAFVGYRSEMGEDEEMLSLLRKVAIENFGMNPVRVIDQDEPVSPLHSAVNKLLTKTSPDRLADLVKELFRGLRTDDKA